MLTDLKYQLIGQKYKLNNIYIFIPTSENDNS